MEDRIAGLSAGTVQVFYRHFRFSGATRERADGRIRLGRSDGEPGRPWRLSVFAGPIVPDRAVPQATRGG